ncbi:hypothetical protein CsatA_003697 [Cannabis sativa]
MKEMINSDIMGLEERSSQKLKMGGEAGLNNMRTEQEVHKGKLTIHLLITCLIAAIGGVILGSVTVPGWFATTGEYYEMFSDYSYKDKSSFESYCKDGAGMSFGLLLIVYLPGIVAAFIASPVTRKYGHKKSIIISAAIFCVSAALLIASSKKPDLLIFFIGQISLGLGIGFGAQAIPLYLSEIAPTHFRGGSNFMFQLAISLGISIASIDNYTDRHLTKPWYAVDLFYNYGPSFGLVTALALLMIVAAIFLTETPISLIHRGSKEKGKKVLEKLRGTEQVEAEFQDMVSASELAKTVKTPFRSIFWKKNRPQLVLAILVPMFRSLTGINSLLYYTSILFLNMGYKDKTILYPSVIIGAILVLSTLLSMTVVDRFGRRVLLISGGIVMLICQIIIAIILAGKVDNQNLSRTLFIVLIVVICLFALAFGWSWGPLAWTIPSEIFPLEIRSTGQSIAVAVNFIVTSVVADSFLPLLCQIKFGIFLFYAGWILLMNIFVYMFLPETKGVSIDDMASVWRNHWFWKKIVPAQHEIS